MQAVSTGFLIESEGKYLLAHTTCHKTPPKQPIQISSITEEKWTVPKGIIDETNKSQAGDAIEIETAIRELHEETGIDLKNNPILRQAFYDQFLKGLLKFPLHAEYKIKSKIVRIYLLSDPTGLISREYPLNAMKCSSLIDSNHPLKGWPEVDAFVWATKQEALRIVLKSQKCLFK